MLHRSRHFLIAWLFAALLLPAATPAPAAEAGSDPKAVALAEATLDAMGGRDAWDGTRHICFTFAGRRHHCWDKDTSRSRLSLEADGKKVVVLLDLNSRQGEVYVDGVSQTDAAREEWLGNAYGAWINDTYWLVMPYKLLDPGVTLSYDRAEQLGDATYDVVKLTFGDVGLTPGDTYWAFLNRDTHLMDRWEYHLQSYGADDPATPWNWTGWQPYGRILLAPGRHNPESGRQLPLDDIAVYDQLPEAVYTTLEGAELP